MPSINCKSDDVVLQIDKRTVRYMTPVEVERCFGLPDGYTDIEGSSKSKRYKALGNSMATLVLTWLGIRLKAVNGLLK